MKRYFLVHDMDMPTVEDEFGHYHFIDLASHGPAGDRWSLLCLVDGHVAPEPAWVPFPSLLDSRTTLAASAVPHECLADLGLTGEETCLEAVVALGDIHALMGI